MGLIRVLPPGLVNRIAAGECVERPASVLKELVENALDAGAARIDVVIHDGGRELIQVSDDGGGMDADDLRLCVQPHATSKIREDEDLFNIQTLGFRGEALPSIGSVSRLRIVSRPASAELAYEIRVDAGEIGPPQPCAAPFGTTVEVRDLFYCVPARRKFLKTPATETGHLTEQLARIALAQPAVSFSLMHAKRLMHRLPAVEDPHRRIADFFGEEVAEGLLPVTRSAGGFALRGWVAPPGRCRKSSKWEYAFVNGRYVRDRYVSHAIKEAYRSLIKPDEYPVAFLFITIDPSQVDVNVHPTKIEVRWRDSNFVHSQVLAAIREKFLSVNLDRGFRPPREDLAQRDRVRAAMVEFFTRRGEVTAARTNTPATMGRPDRSPPARQELTDAPGAGTAAGLHSVQARPADCPPAPPGAGGRVDASRSAEPNAPPRTAIASPEPGAGFPEPTPTHTTDLMVQHSPHLPLAAAASAAAIQIHNTYLVVETPEGLMLIDQHALHERILYEQLRERIAGRPLESQRLLLPDVLRVPPDRLEVLETHADALERLGIELTPSGPQTVTLHAFPLLLERADRPQFVRDLLDLLAEPGFRPQSDTLLHRLLDMMACKAAVKAGDPLTAAEIAALLAQRERAERSSHCPHGRPTTLHVTLRDLERQFKRR